MHSISIISSHRAPHQLEHQEAMAQGFSALGIEPVISSGSVKTRCVAIWGWLKGLALRQQGHEVLVMERGYLGDRFKWTSLGWNGLNGYATFPELRNDKSRFESNFSMLPWKTGGDYALILGQVPNDASLRGMNLMPHYAAWVEKAKAAYGLPVMFRQHPRAAEKRLCQIVKGAKEFHGSLDEALAGAAVAICFNSNSAVDAVLAGVPTVTLDEGAMAWEVSGHAIGDMVRPDREAWAAELAWKQWRLDEIASGVALEKSAEWVRKHG